MILNLTLYFYRMTRNNFVKSVQIFFMRFFMDSQLVIDVMRESLWVLCIVLAPVLMLSLFVGIIISLFQAMTQIQEVTLTFVPKIISVLIFLLLYISTIGNTLNVFTEHLCTHMMNVGSRK